MYLSRSTGRISDAVELFRNHGDPAAVREEIRGPSQLALLKERSHQPSRHTEITLGSRQGELDRYAWACVVLIADVAHFKRFKDKHGHEVGSANCGWSPKRQSPVCADSMP